MSLTHRAFFFIESMGDTSITLCMIVRNEAATLGACLGSVVEAVDRVIVVDTGSSDDTVEIAKAHGAEVREWAWRNDFSLARNESLKGVWTDWIMVIDGDDFFPEGEALRLRSLTVGTSAAAIAVQYEIQKGHTPEPGIKVFRNLPGLRFEGIIHENVRSFLAETEGRVQTTDIVLKHVGYDQGDLSAKRRRNLPLLRRELERAERAGDRMQSLTIRVDMGWCLVQEGEEEEGTSLLFAVLAEMKDRGFPSDGRWELSPLVYLFDYLQGAGRVEEAFHLVQDHRSLFEEHPCFPIYEAIALLGMRRFAEALDAIEKFEGHLAMGAINFSVPSDMVGVQLWEMRGDCLLALGRAGEATGEFERCLQVNPEEHRYQVKVALARARSKGA